MESNFEQLQVPIYGLRKSANCFATAKGISALLQSHPVDIVHSHFGHTSGGIALGCHRAGVPCVVTYHSSEPLALIGWKEIPVLRHLRSQWLRWHDHLIKKHATILIAPSTACLKFVEPNWDAHPERYRLIPNGIALPAKKWRREEARTMLGLPDSAKVLLHVGNFTPSKNHSGLLKIASAVAGYFNHTILLLVGGGPRAPKINPLAPGLRVELAGNQCDVWPYYAAADVLVFPSTSEGFGNVLLEAQAAGLPVVASDIPAHREASAPESHPYALFRLPDYEEGASKVIRALNNSESKRIEVGRTGRAYVEKGFTVESLAHRLANVYRIAQGSTSIPRHTKEATGAF